MAASLAASAWAVTGSGGGESVGEAVVAVDSGYLFDEVDLALEVQAPGGELDLEGGVLLVRAFYIPSFAMRLRRMGHPSVFGWFKFAGVLGWVEFAAEGGQILVDEGGG